LAQPLSQMVIIEEILPVVKKVADQNNPAQKQDETPHPSTTNKTQEGSNPINPVASKEKDKALPKDDRTCCNIM